MTLSPPSDVEVGIEPEERPLTRRELREKWMREEADAAALESQGEQKIVQPEFETLPEPAAPLETQPKDPLATFSSLKASSVLPKVAVEPVEENIVVQPAIVKRRSRLATFAAGAAVLGLTLTVALPAFDFSFEDTAAATPGQLFAARGTSEMTIDVESFESIDELEVAAEAATNHADTFTNDPTALVQYPFSHGVPLTDGFGPRSWPVAGFHDAQDFAPNYGSAIRSIAAGTVLESGLATDGCGYGVKIKHRVDGQEVVSRYCHMVENSPTVKVGDRVKVGQFIGMVGSTGIATGPHLHLVIQVEGTAVDPMTFLAKYNKPKVVAANNAKSS